MSNWEKGARIKGENLKYLPDDHIVWVEWTYSGYGEPTLVSTIREFGNGTDIDNDYCEIYNLTVQTASLKALADDHKARWDAQPEEVKKDWLRILGLED